MIGKVQKEGFPGNKMGVLKKSNFFNTPAESADRIPQILIEN